MLAQDAEPQTLDPALMTGVAEGRIAAALFEGLTRLDSGTLEVRPAMAHRWAVSDDGLTWTFHLRGDAVWTDGTAVTAWDFHYSWVRVLSPETASPYAGLLFDVVGAREYQRGEVGEAEVGIETPEPHTLRVRLVRPVPYFPSLTAFFTLLPVQYKTVKGHGDRWTRPGNIVSNGPLRLESWSFYREITLVRNDRFWDRDRPRPARLRLIPVVDANTQFNMFETGAVDVAFSVPSPILHLISHRPDYMNGPRLATMFLRLNVTRPPFEDATVRRAFARSIDREALVTRVTRGGERATGALVPPVLPGYEPADGLAYDPGAARRLLGERGGALPVVTLLYPARSSYAQVATVLQHQLSRVLGADVRLDPREWKVYLAAMKRLEYDLALGQWIGDYPDPTTFLHCFKSRSGNNRTGWENERYDELLREAEEPRPGEGAAAHASRRMDGFREAERLLVEDEAPIIPLYHPTVRFMVGPRVRGFVPNVMGLVNLADLRAAEDR